MHFNLTHAVEVLQATPDTLWVMLAGLSSEWTNATEGPDTWSPFDVVGHLIHGEHTDWIPRVQTILKHGASEVFEPFDRFAHLEASRGKSMAELLDEFADLREQNLRELEDIRLSEKDLERTGRHPEFGEVTLGQLLATWVVHDLGHIAQIARVLSKQYKDEVGPWSTYLRVIT
ncbi:MAG: DinB family protein [Gemmatimonadales bacterium]|jgi:hypothetical protein